VASSLLAAAAISSRQIVEAWRISGQLTVTIRGEPEPDPTVAGVARWGGERWGRRRALDSSVLNDAVATQDTITSSQRQADRYRPREFGIHESDGAPDEKESRPKHEPPGYQACMMAR